MHNEEATPDLNSRYQQATEDLNRAYEQHVSRLEDKITAHNSNISEAAIEKVLKLVYAIVGFLGALAFVFALFGYQDLKAGITEMARKKVSSWLSYEEQESPIQQRILSIRDRFLIDSVYIRYMRAQTQSRLDFRITDKELSDLVRIANDKDTSLVDYSDILKLYGSSFILGSIKFRGNYQANLFGEIFTEDGFKDQYMKRREFLSVFSHDMSVFPIAKKILESRQEHLMRDAFDVAYNTNPEYAVEYANKHLTGDSFEPIDRQMALALAEHDAESKKLVLYNNRLFEVRGELEGWLYQYFDIFTSLIRPQSKIFTFELRDKKSDAIRSQMALDMFVSLIEEGYGMTISESFGKRLELSKPGASQVGVSHYEAKKIYDNSTMLNKLVQLNVNNPAWIATLAGALEIYHDDEYIVTVMAKLDDTSRITLSDGSMITKKDVVGSIWFTVDSKQNKTLEIAFRDKSGELRRHAVQAVSNMEKTGFSYRFNGHDLYAFAESEDRYLP